MAKKNLEKIRINLIADFLQIINKENMTIENDFIFADYDFFSSYFRSINSDKRVCNIQEVSEILAERIAYYWFIRFLMVYVLDLNHYFPEIINGFSFHEIKESPREDFITAVKTLEKKIAPAYYPFWQTHFERYLTNEIWGKLLSLPETFNWDADFCFSNNGKIENIGNAFEKFNSHTKKTNNGKGHKKEATLHTTQYYTPREYAENMAENSIGRLLIERELKKQYGQKVLPKDELLSEEKEIADAHGWKFYYPLSDKIGIQFDSEDDLSKIKIIDPCMGSGNLLLPVIDILFDEYKKEGFTDTDAVESIFANNIYGIEIDRYTFEIAWFTMMIKAINLSGNFSFNNKLNLVHMETSMIKINGFKESFYNTVSDSKQLLNFSHYVYSLYQDKIEFGSLIKPAIKDYDKALETIIEEIDHPWIDLPNVREWTAACYRSHYKLILQTKVLSDSYQVVITNPPYREKGKLDNNYVQYLNKKYKNYSFDLYAAFLKRSVDFCSKNGIVAALTKDSWCFLSKAKNTREQLPIDSTVLGIQPVTFPGIQTGTTITLLRKMRRKNYKTIINLNNAEKNYEICLNDNKMPQKRIPLDQNYRHLLNFPQYKDIYHVSDFYEEPKNKTTLIRNGYEPIKGITYERYRFEVPQDLISADTIKPFANQGKVRWYGYDYKIINVEGQNINDDNYKACKEGFIAFSLNSGERISARLVPEGAIPGNGCNYIRKLSEDLNFYFFLAYLNSSSGTEILNILDKTQNSTYGLFDLYPYVSKAAFTNYDDVVKASQECVEITRRRWNYDEKSCNYEGPIFYKFRHEERGSLKSIYNNFILPEQKSDWEKIEKNEKLINKSFNDYFNFDNISDDVISKEITYNPSLKDSIEDLISFAVGSILGLHRVAEEWNTHEIPEYLLISDVEMPDEIVEYDKDKNDIVKIFISFIKTVFGLDFFEDNIKFIAETISSKQSYNADNPEEVIRQYFYKDYYKYHLQVFTDPTKGSKKFFPFWQFDSNDEGGLKALIWYHKYTPETLSKIIAVADKIYKPWYQQKIDTATNKNKQKEYTKKLDEINKYIKILTASTDVTIDLTERMEDNYKKFDKRIFYYKK